MRGLVQQTAVSAAGDSSADGSGLVGRSPRFLGALALAQKVACSNIPVLVVGESGTGKELIGKYLHRLSGRRGGFVDVNCAALPDDLIEGLLFGHRRGAFTGASHDAQGIVQQADQGTLFLDELASLAPHLQGKLLRVLESGEFRPIGSTRNSRADFRLVSTLQAEPAGLVAGGFRLDLMQRVAGVTIRLPTLAERPEDVLPLSRFFAARQGAALTEAAEELLEARDWPGNVRELRWLVERAALLSPEGRIERSTLDEALAMGLYRDEGPIGAQAGALTPFDLRALCGAHAGDPKRIAESLGISRATLFRRLRAAGITLRAFKLTPGGSQRGERVSPRVSRMRLSEPPALA